VTDGAAAPLVLVTGAAGKTGRAVLAALAARGARAQAVVPTEAHGQRLRADLDVELAVGDQRQVDVLTSALAGCRAVYAIAPNVSPHEVAMGAAILTACRTAGVPRLVVHSVVHPQLDAMPHHADKGRVEALVIASGLRWTILQPNVYLQNLAGHAEQLRSGRYEVPYGLGRGAAMVDLRDVAEVAARCLLDDVGVHATFELSGPRELSPGDVARIASDRLGRPVVASRQDPDDWRAAAHDLPQEARDRLHAMFAHYDRHGSPGDPTVLRCLLGREPRGAEAYLAALLGR
jgi:NAD(P)H dehydrogenase (quinone)